ncbi:MAG: hypothetical protein K1W20_04830, partial [Lachnospiraceae bacterium]
MGGQAGIRGYVYQGIVAIVKALGENGWNKISVEYHSPLDKVDIALLNDNVLVSAIQVKSSINLFSKKDVIEWLDSLIADVSANSYEVILLGNPDDSANVFINSVEQYYCGENTQKMHNSLGDYETVLDNNKIRIRLLPFDADMLLANVRDVLNQYIERRGYTVKHSVLVKLSQLILGADMLLATEGKYISKQDYEDRIIDWLDLSCGKNLKSDSQFSSVEALFYSNGLFMDRIKPLKIRELQSYLRIKQGNDIKLREIISEISEIDVYEEDSPIMIDGKPCINVKDPLEISNIEPEPYIIEEELKDAINTAIDTLLGEKLSDTFFDMGNLQQRKGFSGEKILVGTANQKRKDNLIWKLVKEISSTYGFENYITVFEDVKILPIVLKNNGRTTDKNITVTFKFSSESTRFLDLKNIADDLCTNYEIAKEINDKHITDIVWTPTEDEYVGWEGNGYLTSVIDAKRYINPKSLAIEKEKVLEEMQQQLQYEVIYDNSNN